MRAVPVICPCDNLTACQRQDEGEMNEEHQKKPNKKRGGCNGEGGVLSLQKKKRRKYDSVLREERDTLCALMCARVTGWGCAQLCQSV